LLNLPDFKRKNVSESPNALQIYFYWRFYIIVGIELRILFHILKFLEHRLFTSQILIKSIRL